MKYFIYLTLNFCLCTFFMGILFLDGEPILFVPALISFVFGVLFVPLIVIRLPLFKRYFTNNMDSLEIKVITMAETKATMLAVSLVTAATLALVFYFLGCEQFGSYCFCGGFSAGFISQYYVTDF